MVKNIGKSLQQVAHLPLLPLERAVVPKKRTGKPLCLVAIIGPPRIGSTLAYLLLCRALPVYYVSNFEYVFYRVPYLAGIMKRTLSGQTPRTTTYHSNYGFVHGCTSPAEANLFWEYWFDYSYIEKQPHPSFHRMDYITRALDALTPESGVVVSGWTAHGYYIDKNRQFFDNTVFICLERDPIDTAISILNRRRTMRGTVREWYSLLPAAAKAYANHDEYTQIAAQVHFTYQRIRKLDKKHRAQVWYLPYNKLCAAPHDFIYGISERLARGGLTVSPGKNTGYPSEFPVSTYRDTPRYADDVKRFEKAFRFITS